MPLALHRPLPALPGLTPAPSTDLPSPRLGRSTSPDQDPLASHERDNVLQQQPASDDPSSSRLTRPERATTASGLHSGEQTSGTPLSQSSDSKDGTKPMTGDEVEEILSQDTHANMHNGPMNSDPQVRRSLCSPGAYAFGQAQGRPISTAGLSYIDENGHYYNYQEPRPASVHVDPYSSMVGRSGEENEGLIKKNGYSGYLPVNQGEMEVHHFVLVTDLGANELQGYKDSKVYRIHHIQEMNWCRPLLHTKSRGTRDY